MYRLNIQDMVGIHLKPKFSTASFICDIDFRMSGARLPNKHSQNLPATPDTEATKHSTKTPHPSTPDPKSFRGSGLRVTFPGP